MEKLDVLGAVLVGRWFTKNDGDSYAPVQIHAVFDLDGSELTLLRDATDLKGYRVDFINAENTVFFSTREEAQAEADELNSDDEDEERAA